MTSFPPPGVTSVFPRKQEERIRGAKKGIVLVRCSIGISRRIAFRAINPVRDLYAAIGRLLFRGRGGRPRCADGVRVPSRREHEFRGIILRNDVDRGLAERWNIRGSCFMDGANNYKTVGYKFEKSAGKNSRWDRGHPKCTLSCRLPVYGDDCRGTIETVDATVARDLVLGNVL